MHRKDFITGTLEFQTAEFGVRVSEHGLPQHTHIMAGLETDPVKSTLPILLFEAGKKANPATPSPYQGVKACLFNEHGASTGLLYGKVHVATGFAIFTRRDDLRHLLVDKLDEFRKTKAMHAVA